MNNSILRRITVFFAIYFASCIVSYAQVDSPYLPDSLYGTTVTLKANKRIYMPTYEQASAIHTASLNKKYYNFTIDISKCKTKKIPKQSSFVVTCFFRTQKEIDYDLYGVFFKNSLYFIRPEDVVDNSLIEDTNLNIREEYDRLLWNEHRLKNDYDNLKLSKEDEIIRALNKIDDTETKKDAIIDSIYMAKFEEVSKPIKEEYNNWYDKLNQEGRKAAEILTIQHSTLYAPNSAGGCDYSLGFTNMSNKTIKYLYWYGSIYNAVNDKVDCSIRGTYFFSGKCTGPYAPSDYCEANWDTIIYNWSAKEIKFSKITVMYMDGTSVSLSAKDILSISDAPQCVIPKGESSLLNFEVRQSYNDSLRKERKIWEKRKKSLPNIEEEVSGLFYDEDLEKFYRPLIDLENKIKESSVNLTNFESRNFITK